MADVLLDSSVLLDIFTQDPEWFEWSSETVAEMAESHALVINPVVYAEISIRFDRIEELEAVLGAAAIERRGVPWEAAFLAGKCFVTYRKKGGPRRSPLPDFLIGAHAAVTGMPLVTRDARRYRTYFPKLEVVAPS